MAANPPTTAYTAHVAETPHARRTALAERLRAETEAIEGALLTRIQAIADPSEVSDPSYALSLRTATAAALEYAIAAVERGDRRAPEIPLPLIAQARFAARSGVSLDTVLRRYFAGYTLFGDLLVHEAETSELEKGELKSLLRSEASSFNRLIEAVSEEYGREASNRSPQSSKERLAEMVRRLLDGEPQDASSLGYQLDARHLGLIATGEGAEETIRALAQALDQRLLFVPQEGEVVWAWLGGRRAPGPEEIERLVPNLLPQGASLVIGEPGEGKDGWRLTHQQARAALSIAERSDERFTRYADVALVAAALKDELLATSLRRIYLEPLEEERDGGEAVRRTLSAYFASGHHVSAAASALGVSRQTVNSRLRVIEQRVGRSLSASTAELAVVLQLDGLSA